MLFEKYRPRTWADFIGNEKAVRVAKAAVNRAKSAGEPVALWIEGASGTGKTTLAHLLAAELAAHPVCVVEYDGQGCDAAKVREIDRALSLKPFVAGSYSVVIVNEAQAMTDGAVQGWLTALERLQGRKAVMFTTTEGRGEKAMFGAFDAPLLSRCIEITMTTQGLADDFAALALRVAEAEGLGGATTKQATRLVQDCKNNMRKVFSAIARGALAAQPAAQAA